MKYLLCFLVPVCLCFTAPLAAQTARSGIQISGDSIPAYTLRPDSFAAIKHVTLTAKGHDEKEHQYTGVLLADVLSKAGVHLGEGAKKATAATYVLVKAADNYTALFALAEVDPLFTDKTILLADRQDGKSLPQAAGPFQVIVPGEKKHARWIRQVVSITITIAH